MPRPCQGPAGEAIFNTVSRKAWLEWQTLQTMLINEKALDLRDPEARLYLNEQRERFLDNEENRSCGGLHGAQARTPDRGSSLRRGGRDMTSRRGIHVLAFGACGSS